MQTTTLPIKSNRQLFQKRNDSENGSVIYIDVRVKEIENQIAYAKSNIKMLGLPLFLY